MHFFPIKTPSNIVTFLLGAVTLLKMFNTATYRSLLVEHKYH